MRDPRIDFTANARPPWLDLDVLREAFRAAGFVETSRDEHTLNFVFPVCASCNSTNIEIIDAEGSASTSPPRNRISARCRDCNTTWAVTDHGSCIHALVPLDWTLPDSAYVARRAIGQLERVTGPRVDLGPLTERELALYDRIEQLEERAVEAEASLAWAEQSVDCDEDPDHPPRFVLIDERVPGVDVGPNERVARVEWATDSRHVCSLWFPADDLGWRFYLPTPWPGWSDKRYVMWEDAAQAAVDAIHAWPTVTPWFDPPPAGDS